MAAASAAGANPGDEQERWDFIVGVGVVFLVGYGFEVSRASWRTTPSIHMVPCMALPNRRIHPLHKFARKSQGLHVHHQDHNIQSRVGIPIWYQ